MGVVNKTYAHVLLTQEDIEAIRLGVCLFDAVLGGPLSKKRQAEFSADQAALQLVLDKAKTAQVRNVVEDAEIIELMRSHVWDVQITFQVGLHNAEIVVTFSGSAPRALGDFFRKLIHP